MSRVRASTMVAVLAAALMPSGIRAQAPARYLYVATITAKFGQIQDFVEYERQIQEARRRTGDPRSVSVYQLQVGGAPNTYVAVIGFDDLAEMDSWPSVLDLLNSAYGDRDGARIYAEGTAALESVDYAVQAFQPDASSGTAMSPEGTTLVQVVTTTVRPDLVDDYNAFLAALKAAEDKRGIKRTRRNVAIGPVPTFSAITQASGWSTVRSDPGPPAVILDEYGESLGGSLLARADAAVVNRTIQVLRLREDLSYSPN